MKRREFVRSALAVTFAPTVIAAQTGTPVSAGSTVISPGPLPWMQGLNHVDDHHVPYLDIEQICTSETHLFTTTQMETLVRLCEIFMPPMMGLPGAVESLTPDFLDFFVSRSAPEVKSMYQTGLDMLQSSAQRSYSEAFAALDAAQCDALIRPLLAPWLKDHLPKEPGMRFVNRVHFDIRLATKNSGAWALAEARLGHPPPVGNLYWFPVEPDVAFRDTLQPGAPARSV